MKVTTHHVGVPTGLAIVCALSAYLSEPTETPRELPLPRDSSLESPAPTRTFEARGWPVLTNANAGEGRELEVHRPAPRGALRVWNAPENLVLCLEEVRYLAPLEQRAPDFVGERQGRPFTEFYGLDAGLRRGFFAAHERESSWTEFRIVPGEITELAELAFLERRTRLLRLEDAGETFTGEATLRLLGGRVDHLVSWGGIASELPGALPGVNSLGIRFAGQGPVVRFGGVVPVESDGPCLLGRLSSGGAPLRITGAPIDGSPAETIRVLNLDERQPCPWVVDVLTPGEFRIPSTSYTRVQSEGGAIDLTVLEPPQGSLVVGIARSEQAQVQLYRECAGRNVVLVEDLESGAPAAVLMRSEVRESGQNRWLSVHLGPWRTVSSRPDSPIQIGWLGQRFERRQQRTLAGSWVRDHQGDRRVRLGSADSPANLRLHLGIDLEVFGVEELDLLSFSQHVEPADSSDSAQFESVVRRDVYEVRASIPGFLISGLGATGSPVDAVWTTAEPEGRARVVWNRPTADVAESLQFPGFQVQSLPDSRGSLDFEVPAPVEVVVVPRWSGRPRGLWIELLPGDVLVIDHD